MVVLTGSTLQMLGFNAQILRFIAQIATRKEMMSETAVESMGNMKDRISSLPDELIQQIFSHLTMEEAVPTSILSKRWRYQWRFKPNLVFPRYTNFSDMKHGKCTVAAIDQCIHLYKPQLLECLMIDLCVKEAVKEELTKWVDFALNREVKYLSVTVVLTEAKTLFDTVRFRVPDSLFLSRSLQVLELSGCEIYPPPSNAASLDSLVHLCLTSVEGFRGGIHNLISKCNGLRYLSLHKCFDGGVDLTDLKISMPHLLLLKFDCVFGTVEIDAPNIQILSCKWWSSQQRYINFEYVPQTLYISKAPHLKEVTLQCSQFERDLKFVGKTLENISGTKGLSLSSRMFELILAEYDLKDSKPPLFDNLELFHLNEVNSGRLGYYSLARFFKHCPSLEKVCIEFLGPKDYRTPPLMEDKTLLCESDLCMDHVKVVKLVNFVDGGKEMGLVKFFLEKAACLEKLILKWVLLPPNGNVIRKKISGFHKASPHATIEHRT